MLLLLLAASALWAEEPIKLSVDASEAPRRIFHARMAIPVKPGPLTLMYPKWIPGEHGPTGPIADLAGLKLTADGKPLSWRRDPVDMYAIHCDVPGGVTSLDVTLDYLSPPQSEGFSSGASATAQLAVLSWNQMLLYPKGTPADQLNYQTDLRVPAGWKFGTALPIVRESGDHVEFAPATLTTLIDSPVLAGRNFKTVYLSPDDKPAHYLHMAADAPEAVEISDALIANYYSLVKETGALFGARHYRSYHFLLSLSDNVAHFGLEHHESSDNRLPESALTEDGARKLTASLLPHEMVHSWNGKYRRPRGLATGDYQQPMQGELLWVYEGLTEYLGEVLTARSNLQSADEFRERLALVASGLDLTVGRTWRPLLDTTIGAQILYPAREDWAKWRRSVDFYPEGLLIWLEADVAIRKQSNGKRSLDDFCRRFYGGQSGTPEVKPYTFDELVAALQAVEPYDWKGFFTARLTSTAPRAPVGGIEQGGWRVGYSATPPQRLKWLEDEDKTIDFEHSIGMRLKDDGMIIDIIPGSAADKSGVAPAMKLIAVNGREFTGKALRAAIRAAGPLELLAKNGAFFKTYTLEYRGGERYPRLERDESKPDVLSEIIRARAR